MMKFLKNRITAGVLLALGFGSAQQSFAQDGSVPYDPSLFIKTEINSGNPAYPYPQFLEYKGGGKSLAKYNAEGVTHADMEKAGRESYEIMMHRCRYEGNYCGVDYISFNRDDVPHNYGTFVSEGDGYALLAAAIFADQKTFNGLYMWIHDIRFAGVKRFRDGKSRGETANDFAGPYLAAWKDKTFDAKYGSDSHSATDGDVDIAMAMLVAYKQWGEWMKQDGEIVKDSEGNPISLKYETQRVVGALVDTLGQWDKGSGALTGYLCGVIGIDGYEKRGNSWGELTRWRFTDDANQRYPNVNGPYNGGPNLYSIYGENYIDYDAPAYFEEFWRWLKNSDGVDKNNEKVAPWEIHQFKRAAASGNWLNQKAYEQGLIASIGKVDMETDGEPTFGVYVDGEDFRYPWRHLIDYLWHGDADYDWDPKTHQVIEGSNNSERLMGIRHAEMLKEPSKDGEIICSKMGASPDPGQPMWSGVSQIPQQWTPTGGLTSFYHTNYSVGAGSPAAVISEDLELLADIYRQCEILWDGHNTNVGYYDEERYEGSTPKYFHGWFRTLGMLVCSGNLAAPEDMKPIANAKVYMSVDKTYAYQYDNVTYGVQFRNYGTLDAEGVTIKTKLDPNYEFVSATGNGKYDKGSHSITWNVGSIKGFKTGGLAATMDSVFFTVNVKDTLNKRICLTSTISGTNFDDWVSNEYPNHATYTMERNCVDILANRSLSIKKTASRKAMNPNDVVAFTVEFENKSEGEASWMNGGREHVRISYANNPTVQTNSFLQFFRFWNDSYESYINMSNYRVSYFMYDATAKGLYDAEKNKTGWTFKIGNQNDMDKYGYNPPEGPCTFSYQKIPQGQDPDGKRWNQRLMIRFANVLMAPSTHVYDKLNGAYLCHKGVYGPGLIRADLSSNPASDIQKRLVDDWSFADNISTMDNGGQQESFYPVTPSWADVNNLGYDIETFTRHVCDPLKVKNFDRVLVEEFDGYTWRRIQGRGPLPGKEAYNVTIADTIPYELVWVGWKDSTALKDEAGNKIEAKYTPAANPKAAGYTGIVSWTIPEMLVGEKDKLIYLCKARDLGCPDVDDAYYKNVAWIWSDTDSPDSSQVDLMTSCNELPPVDDPQASLFKEADRTAAEQGETVNYKVKFVNTEGTRIDANCKSTTGWKALGSGTLPKTTANGLSLSFNSGTPYFFAPEMSYGKDGAVYATIGGTPYSTQNLYIVFRYKGGTPGKADFEGLCMQLKINLAGNYNFGYVLWDNGKEFAAEGTSWDDATQFPPPAETPTFKFVLKGDHLYMYINDEEDEWVTVIKEWGGLKASGPGYFGMYATGDNGTTQLNSFITELDYAFNVKLSDKLPKELGNIDNITGNGVWNETKNEIEWPVECTTTATALAPGDSIVRTFSAEVVDCDKYISNRAVATVYGKDSLKTTNTIECGAAKCSLEKVTIKSAAEVFCETDSMVIKATATAKGDYTYQWYDGEDKVGKATKNLDSLVVKKTGSYWVEVSVADDATCEPVKSKALAISADAMPLTTLIDTSACDGSTVELKATEEENATYVYKWSDRSTDATLSVTEDGEYSVVVTNGTCVAKDTAKVTFGSESLIDVIYDLNGVKYVAGDTGNVCPNSVASLTVNQTSADGTYKWSSKPTGFISSDAESKEIEINPEGLTTYYVTMMGSKCEATDSFVVKVGKAPLKGGVFTLNGKDYPRSEGNSGSVCPGTENTLSVNYEPKEGGFKWSSKPNDAKMAADGSSVSISPSKKTTYYVSFMMDCEALDSFEVDVNEPMEIELKRELLCNAVKMTAEATGSASPEYHWSVEGDDQSGTDAVLVIDGSEYASGSVEVYATATDACQSETVSKDFTVYGMKAELSGSKTVCPGLTTELSVVAESDLDNAKFSYQWMDKDKANIATATSSSYEAGAGTYYVNVKMKDIEGCDTTIKHVIAEGSGALETADGEPGVMVGGEGVKNRTYYYCGTDAVTIASNYRKDSGSEYEWTVLDASGNATSETYSGTANVTPTGDMAIALKFKNQCDAFDTLYIKIPEKVAIEPTVKTLCGETTIEFSNTKPTYKWSYGDNKSEGKKFTAKLADFPSAAGSVTVTAEAEGYCPAETTLAIAIDTLGVRLTAPESVCEDGKATLLTTAVTSNTTATLTYSYASRPAGSNSVFKSIEGSSDEIKSPSLSEATEFQVTVSDGVCEKTASQKVTIDIPKPDGVIRINGDGVSEDSKGVKTYKTCGEALAISASHNGSGYVWTLEGETKASGKEATLSPNTDSQHTEQYVLSYSSESGCPVSDTVNIEVYPLSASIDWTTFNGTYCEGENTKATLVLEGYDKSMSGSYIKWYRDGDELTTKKGQSELSLSNLQFDDSGTYSYEVSNGLCSRPTTADEGTISVQKRVAMTIASTTIVVPRGEDGTIELTTDVAGADIRWYDATEGDHKEVGSGSPLTLPSVDRDYQLVVEVKADGYCTDKMQVSILADAKTVVSLTADSLYNCTRDMSNRLVVDTTGTGSVRNPGNYKIEIMASTDGGETYTTVSRDVVEYLFSINAKTTYKAVVTYGSQVAESDPVTIAYYAPASFKEEFPEKSCKGSEVEIKINNLKPFGAEVEWDEQEGLTGNGTSATALLDSEGSHIYGYSIVQNDGKCRERFSVAIEAVAPIEVESADTTVCEGGTAKLMAISTGTPKFYHWYAGDAFVGDKSTVKVSPEATTTYTVWISNGICDSVSATATVTVAEAPVITSVAHRSVKHVEVLVEGGEKPYEFAVDNSDYQDESEFDIAKYGVHTYKVRDLYGCETSAIDTLPAPVIKVPTVVTTNGDGVNDAFEVPGMAEAYPDATVKIYDRWGKQIAEYKASEGSWDGTYNGNKMPSTDYWYEIYIPELYKYYTGHFTLMHE